MMGITCSQVAQIFGEVLSRNLLEKRAKVAWRKMGALCHVSESKRLAKMTSEIKERLAERVVCRKRCGGISGSENGDQNALQNVTYIRKMICIIHGRLFFLEKHVEKLFEAICVFLGKMYLQSVTTHQGFKRNFVGEKRFGKHNIQMFYLFGRIQSMNILGGEKINRVFFDFIPCAVEEMFAFALKNVFNLKKLM